MAGSSSLTRDRPNGHNLGLTVGRTVPGPPMIQSLRLRNFKNFGDTTIRFGPFSVVAGENATGKSNVGDALRVLSGIATQLDLDPILKGLERPIRSGAKTSAIDATFVAPDGETLRYAIAFGASGSREQAFRVVHEELCGDGEVILIRSDHPEVPVVKPKDKMTAPVYVRRNNGQLEPMDNRRESLTALFGSLFAGDVPEACLGYILYLWGVLKQIRCFALVPRDLRGPGAKGAEVLGESGRDFPSVLRQVCEDPERKESVVEWLHELTPTDIQDLGFFEDPDGRVHIEVEERNGGRFGVHNVSDGTLRFMAVLTAVFGAQEHATSFLDELETGLHPSRVWLLVRLLEQHVGANERQVIATTHSPEVLDHINDRTFQDSTVLARIRGRNSVSAHRLQDLPDAGRLRRTQGFGRLLRNGWMEDALYLQDEEDRESDDSLEKAVR